MNTENVGAYSPDIIYGQLTMPFINKPVKINSHTPYDKVENTQQSFSQADFQKNVNNNKWKTIEDIRDIKSMELNEQLSFDFSVTEKKDNASDAVSAFQSSTLKDGTGIVYEALKNGYSSDKAIIAGKAYKTYSQMMEYEKNNTPVNSLINRNFQVK